MTRWCRWPSPGCAESGHPLAHEGAGLLNATVLDLLDGQSADVGFEDRADVTLPECMRMAGSKTGALIACACALRRPLRGADAKAIDHLRAFGAELGLAFQLADDLLGIWGDPAVTGKPVFSDLANRKKSLPVVAALDVHDRRGRGTGRDLPVGHGPVGRLSWPGPPTWWSRLGAATGAAETADGPLHAGRRATWRRRAARPARRPSSSGCPR